MRTTMQLKRENQRLKREVEQLKREKAALQHQTRIEELFSSKNRKDPIGCAQRLSAFEKRKRRNGG